MFQLLIERVSKNLPLAPRDIDLCARFFVPIEAGKDELLAEAGAVSKYLYFINSGAMCSYYTTRGREVLTQLAGAGSFICGFDSFVSQRSSRENIKAITPTGLLRISKKQLDLLYASSDTWARNIRIIYQQLIRASEANHYFLEGQNSTECINSFFNRYPGMRVGVPCELIARFLQVTVTEIEEHLNNWRSGKSLSY